MVMRKNGRLTGGVRMRATELDSIWKPAHELKKVKLGSFHSLQIPGPRGPEPTQEPDARRAPGRRGLFRRHAQKPASRLFHRVCRASGIHARHRSPTYRLASLRPPGQALRQTV